MNEIRREDRDSKLIHDISAVVERHGWPDTVSGYSLRLGEYEGDPAVWITYHMKSKEFPLQPGWKERADHMNEIANAVSFDLVNVDENRQTFFRYSEPN